MTISFCIHRWPNSSIRLLPWVFDGEALISLPYAAQRLGHAYPALGPVRALLVRVSLGPCPWLHRLGTRQPSFVRRLHSCRVGGGALDCSRAGLRPPLKLGVQFSRTQLSRRRRSLRGDGRDHRNQVHKPVLAVELTAWQRSPTAAAPLVVPVRPDPPYQPSVEPVEELSDLGPLVVVAPATHDGIDLLYQLSSGHRCATSREPTNLLLEVVDRFLSGIGIERSPSGTRLDLACRQVHGPAPSLDLVPEKFEAVPNVHNPRLLRVNGHTQLLQDTTCRL